MQKMSSRLHFLRGARHTPTSVKFGSWRKPKISESYLIFSTYGSQELKLPWVFCGYMANNPRKFELLAPPDRGRKGGVEGKLTFLIELIDCGGFSGLFIL